MVERGYTVKEAISVGQASSPFPRRPSVAWIQKNPVYSNVSEIKGVQDHKDREKQPK